jgi:hypothetical protein
LFGNTAVRRFSLVLRFWHFHIHRASVSFDLQRRFAAEGDGIQATSAARMRILPSGRSASGLRGNSLPCPSPAQALWGDLDTKPISSWCPRAVATVERQEPLVSACDRNGRREPLAFPKKPKCAGCKRQAVAVCRPDATSLCHFKGSAWKSRLERSAAAAARPHTAPWNDCKEPARASAKTGHALSARCAS